MQFYDVQIPNRVFLPLIHKRGPIGSITLDEDTIKELMEMGITVLDAQTGHALTFQCADSVVENVDETDDAEEPETSTPDEASSSGDDDDSTTNSQTENKTTSEAVQAPSNDDTQSTQSDNAEAHNETIASSSVLDAFNYEMIEGYTGLSKPSRRQIRSAYLNMRLAGKTDDEIYPELNTMRKDLQ